MTDRVQALRASAAKQLLEADRLERHATSFKVIVRGELDGYAIADLLGRAHTLYLAFSTSTIDRQPGDRPLPLGRA